MPSAMPDAPEPGLEQMNKLVHDYVRKRLVVYTSSLVPACLNPDREPAHIFRRTALAHDVFVSSATFDELAAVLTRDKFNAWRSLEYLLI